MSHKQTVRQSDLSDSQVEMIIKDIAKGRIGTLQEEYQLLKNSLRIKSAYKNAHQASQAIHFADVSRS